MNIWNLTDHQLEVIKTFAIVGGNTGTFIGAVLMPFIIKWVIQIRRAARNAEHQTRREEWMDGKLHTMDVAELTSKNLHSTQELRGEITDLYNDPPVPKEHGRRRLPTDNIRTIQKPGESTYE